MKLQAFSLDQKASFSSGELAKKKIILDRSIEVKWPWYYWPPNHSFAHHHGPVTQRKRHHPFAVLVIKYIVTQLPAKKKKIKTKKPVIVEMFVFISKLYLLVFLRKLFKSLIHFLWDQPDMILLYKMISYGIF